jgi:putative membrane protein
VQESDMRPLHSIAAIALSAVLSVPVAFAQLIKSDQKIDNADAAAMKQLAQANLAEIEAGKLAAAKAQSPDVKSFGQKMVDDHGRMLEDLKTLAKSKGVALPDALSLRDLAERKKLERHSGPDFDKTYMSEMVKDHEKDLKEVQDLAAKAKDPDFKAAMQKASAKIQEHLQLAQRISQGAAAGATTSSTPSSGTEVKPNINFSK